MEEKKSMSRKKNMSSSVSLWATVPRCRRGANLGRARPWQKRVLWRLGLSSVIVAVLAGCESPAAPDAPPRKEARGVKGIPEPATPSAATGAVIVRLHGDTAAEMPEGATSMVTLAKKAVLRSAEMNKNTRLVQFGELPAGRYELSVSLNSADVEIGFYSYPIQVTEGVRDVTVPIDLLRGDLVVGAVVKPVLEQEYSGVASIVPTGCIDTNTARALRSDLGIVAEGDDIELTVANFQGATLTLSGRIDGAAPLKAAGAYESSDGTAGAWELTQLAAPTSRSVAARINFNNKARSCAATLEFTGLSDRSAVAGQGMEQAEASIEVVGHGQTHTATLGPDTTAARFDGLLIGSYDVIIDVRHNEQSADIHRELLMLGTEGAEVATEFEVNRSLARAQPLAWQRDRGFLNQAYEGKSVVSQGAPECTGSIALVDATKLVTTADGSTITLAFDNFYGKILELTGKVANAGGVLAASGTYQSSDAKTGSWTLDFLTTPTPQQLVMLVNFKNDTDSCQATYEFSGQRESA